MQIPTWAWWVVPAGALAWWLYGAESVRTKPEAGWSKMSGPYKDHAEAMQKALSVVTVAGDDGVDTNLLLVDEGKKWRLTQYADGWWVEWYKGQFSGGANSGGGVKF